MALPEVWAHRIFVNTKTEVATILGGGSVDLVDMFPDDRERMATKLVIAAHNYQHGLGDRPFAKNQVHETNGQLPVSLQENH